MLQRLLRGDDGSLLAKGQKSTALDVVGRLSNETQSMFDLWLRSRRLSALPLRADFDFMSLPDLIPSVLVADVLPETDDYRYRFVGWREVEARCMDPTGLTVRQCYSGEGLDFVLESYGLTVQHREPFVDLSLDVAASQSYVETETLFLPLSEDGTSVTQILVYSHYLDAASANAVLALRRGTP